MSTNEFKLLAEHTCQLLAQDPPGEWISFLFDLQNALINFGHIEGYTELGRKDFAGKFSGLKHFFEQLDTIK